MTGSIEASFAYCRRVTRRRARNFYYSFVLLRRSEHDALCALYAFMRYCDDLSDDGPSDDTHQARAALERWRADLEEALGGRLPEHPVWPAFVSTVHRYQLPHDYFTEMIDGVGADLEPVEFRSFDDLYRYCYRVASVAGLSVIRVLGFNDPRALELAERCGVAFQLTNILRDVKEDAARGRVYFPVEDLARFGLTREELLSGTPPDALRELMRFEAGRAREYYSASAGLPGLVPLRNRPSLSALIEIYGSLLDKIERSGFDVMGERISLSAWQKSWIVVRAAAGCGLRRAAR